MKIYYEDNHLIVIDKPVNQPSQLDSSSDLDTLTMVKNYIKEEYNKPGNVYLALLHRLDRPVSGLMVFAKTSKAASRMNEQLRKNTWEKKYLAVVEGEVKLGKYIDYLYKDNKTNTSYVVDESNLKGKKAILEIIDTKYNEEHNLSLVTINLITGRSHQIRVQMQNNLSPLWGDARYNPNAKPGEQIALYASELSIDHPTLKKRMTFKGHTPNVYPFTLW